MSFVICRMHQNYCKNAVSIFNELLNEETKIGRTVTEVPQKNTLTMNYMVIYSAICIFSDAPICYSHLSN